MNCPRDASILRTDKDHGIEVERCSQCQGAWYDFGELEELEATAAHSEDALAGMLQYSKRPSELKCPVCGKEMVAFDYRANNVELDACTEEHGFWLDAGESDRVRDIMRERARGLDRSASVQRTGKREREGGFKPGGVIDQIRRLFGGR